MDLVRKSQACTILAAHFEDLLQHTEQSSSSLHRYDHGTELPNPLLPLIGVDAALIGGSSNSNRCRIRCTGISTARRIVSRIQPKIIFIVVQVASPFHIFLTDVGYCRCLLSCWSTGRKILPSVCSSTRLTWRR
jgi:hypothetical protein